VTAPSAVRHSGTSAVGDCAEHVELDRGAQAAVRWYAVSVS
jgi:hypothetical protein